MSSVFVLCYPATSVFNAATVATDSLFFFYLYKKQWNKNHPPKKKWNLNLKKKTAIPNIQIAVWKRELIFQRRRPELVSNPTSPMSWLHISFQSNSISRTTQKEASDPINIFEGWGVKKK